MREKLLQELITSDVLEQVNDMSDENRLLFYRMLFACIFHGKVKINDLDQQQLKFFLYDFDFGSYGKDCKVKFPSWVEIKEV